MVKKMRKKFFLVNFLIFSNQIIVLFVFFFSLFKSYFFSSFQNINDNKSNHNENYQENSSIVELNPHLFLSLVSSYAFWENSSNQIKTNENFKVLMDLIL